MNGERILLSHDPATDRGFSCGSLFDAIAEPPQSPDSMIVLVTSAGLRRTLAMSHRDRVGWELTIFGKERLRDEVDARERSDEIAEDWRDTGEDADEEEIEFDEVGT